MEILKPLEPYRSPSPTPFPCTLIFGKFLSFVK